MKIEDLERATSAVEKAQRENAVHMARSLRQSGIAVYSDPALSRGEIRTLAAPDVVEALEEPEVEHCVNRGAGDSEPQAVDERMRPVVWKNMSRAARVLHQVLEEENNELRAEVERLRKEWARMHGELADKDADIANLEFCEENARSEMRRLRKALRQADVNSRERCAQELEQEADAIERDHPLAVGPDSWRRDGLRHGARLIRACGEGGE